MRSENLLLKNGLLHHQPKINFEFKKIPAITESETQLFPFNFICQQCFKKLIRKPNKLGSCFFYAGPPPTKPAKTHWGQDMTKYVIEPHAKMWQSLQKLCNGAFSKII